ncbi:MAG: acyltransferase family protein [Cyanobacteria bacterium P01_C01_bin.72]
MRLKQPQLNPNRHLFFIDLFKAVSIIAVVSFHGIFVPGETYAALISPLEIAFSPLRFCVPLFFTISFFLYERSESKQPSKSLGLLLHKRLPRLLYPLAVWFSVGILLNLAKGNSLTDIFQAAATGEIFTGSYYLLALLQLLPLFFYLRQLTDKISLISGFIWQIVMGIIIYAALQQTALPSLISYLQMLDRPLFIYWLAYITLGIYFARNLTQIQTVAAQMPLPVKICLILALGGLFIHDYQLLSWLTEQAIAPFDYLTPSSLLSVPIIFCCFSHLRAEQFPPWLVQVIKTISQYGLGIFCLNGTLRLVFLSLGSSIWGEQVFSWTQILAIKLIGWLILLLVSLGLSVLLARIGLKKAVC